MDNTKKQRRSVGLMTILIVILTISLMGCTIEEPSTDNTQKLLNQFFS